jgi:hypothetical protein
VGHDSRVDGDVKGTRKVRRRGMRTVQLNKKGHLHSRLSDAFRGYIFIQLTRATIISRIRSITVVPTLVLPGLPHPCSHVHVERDTMAMTHYSYNRDTCHHCVVQAKQ